MPEQGRLMPAIDASGKSISGMADVGDVAAAISIESVSAEMDCRTGYREGKAKREAAVFLSQLLAGLSVIAPL
jgi:hypothetical protein